MTTKTGTIEQMHESGKRFKLDDGNWYSAFSISQMGKGVGVGDTVGFAFSEVNKDGKTYYNIKGNVSHKAAGTSSSPSADKAAAAPAAKASTASYSRGAFPVPPLDGSRSIIRQNALTQANTALSNWFVEGGGSRGEGPGTEEEYADRVIALARKFEAYSAGDLDAAEAEKAMEAIRAAAAKSEAYT